MMKWKPTYKVQEDVKPSDREIYLCEVEGNAVTGVPLIRSKEVTKGKSHKRFVSIASSAEPSQNQPSARINKKTGRTLDKGIQLYRMWFNYLKLALELEELGVSLVTKNPTSIKNHKNPNEPMPQEIIDRSYIKGSGSKGDSGVHAIFR